MGCPSYGTAHFRYRVSVTARSISLIPFKVGSYRGLMNGAYVSGAWEANIKINVTLFRLNKLHYGRTRDACCRLTMSSEEQQVCLKM